MKKISLVMSLIFILSLFPYFSVTVYADTTNKTDYNIQIEQLSDSPDAKELNKYRKRILNYLNKEAKSLIRASGSDYALLELEDLDFKDNSKISGLKIHGSYHEYEYSVKYDDFMNSLETNDLWSVIIIKDDTLYDLRIFKSDDPEKYKYYVYEIGGGWYIRSCQLCLKKNFWPTGHKTDVVINNMENLLEKYNVYGTDIKVVFTSFGDDLDMEWGDHYYTNCAVVFVDGMAQHIYAFNLQTPYYYRETSDAPQEVLDALSYCAGGVYSGTYFTDYDEIQIFRDYNMIMSLFRLYEYYNKGKENYKEKHNENTSTI